VGDLQTYDMPIRPAGGLLFGLSAARLASVATAGVVFIAAMASPTATTIAGGLATIVMLLAGAAVKVGGRALVDWIPIAGGYGWRMATRRNEFYSSPELARPLPDGVLDLPGELFGLELHTHDPTTAAHVANPSPAGFGVLRDTFRQRMIAVAEISAGGFLFGDPDDQQSRIGAWGRLLDHVAQSLPEICRLQLLHSVGPASTEPLRAHHARHGGRGSDDTATSYRQVLHASGAISQEHRLLLAVALDLRAARRAVRQAGGGADGAARVLLDRAATIEETLTGAGLDVHGWLPARQIAQVLRVAFDPDSRTSLDQRPADVNDGGGIDPAAAGPAGMIEGWGAVRHDSGWSTTLQVVRPPSRPVTGDFLGHLLIGVDAQRRLSILYVPTAMATAERRAQTQQVATESEQTLRARWGFGTSARHARAWQDAARREEDLVDGRTVYRIVWLITVTAPSLAQLDAAVGQVDAAARRCALELRRLAGSQRQAFGWTLPLCRGAR